MKREQPTLLRHAVVEPQFSDVPEVVGVEITGRCNLRCKHCFNESSPDNEHELSLGEIESLLDEMLSWNVRRLRISGGEPTVHPGFRDLVDACRRRDITIAMNTNGIYSRAMLEYLETAPIELFLVSIDGLEANNDAIRGRGTFQRALDACRRLHAAGQEVIVSCHVGAGNCRDVAGLVGIAAEIGVDVKLSPLRPIGRARQELPAELIRPDDFLAVVEDVVELRRRHTGIRILTDFDILDGPPVGDCQPDPARASCKAGRTMINVNYDGGIYPCAFFVTPGAEFCAGNIRDGSITDTWRRSEVFSPFRVHQKSTACRSCAYYGRRCAGGCPAIAHFTTGRLDAHDPTCFADLVEPPNGGSE